MPKRARDRTQSSMTDFLKKKAADSHGLPYKAETESEFERLEVLAEQQNKQVVNVQSDGNCLFSALALQLGGVISSEEVRLQLVDYLQHHPELVLNTGLMNTQELQVYLEQMRLNGTWGDGIMLSVAVNCYRRPIKILTVEGEQRIDMAASDETLLPQSPIQLGMVNQNHYVSIADAAVTTMKRSDGMNEDADEDDDNFSTAKTASDNHHSVSSAIATSSDSQDDHTASENPVPQVEIPRSTGRQTNGSNQQHDISYPAKITSHYSEADCIPTGIVNDIGLLINATMDCKEIEGALSKLTDGQKYSLLVHHWEPSTHYIFPSTYMNGCNRSCSYKWLQRYPWLVYSPKLDGVFCISCAVMARVRENKGILVNKPFTRWTKLSDTLKTHSQQESHCQAMHDAENLKVFVERPAGRITVLIDKERESIIETNRHILQVITQVLLLCGRQCIALRGSIENIANVDHNPGNFLAILKYVAEHDPVVQQHVLHPRKKNCQYLSPQIQNELISIIGDNIRERILAEAKAAKFYSVMADEVDCHNQEQMPLCIRFVDANSNVREEFLEFCSLKRITGEAIAASIKESLGKFDLDLSDLRGQCYDGAASMSGVKSGVQSIMRRDAPDAVYVHCTAHCLNLVIAHSSSITPVDNMLNQLKEVHLFFNYSPKREGLLKSIVLKEVPHAVRRRTLLQICTTRWAARQESYRHFYQAYVFIVKALEVIAHNMHSEDLEPEFRTSWDSTSKASASSILHAITSFQFIVTFLIVYMALDYLDGLTRKLQGRTLDILQAYQMINEVKNDVSRLRNDIDMRFMAWYNDAERLVTKVGEVPRMPRITNRQQNRSNAAIPDTDCNCHRQPCSCHIVNYYRLNVAIPFVDHVCRNLDDQFSDLSVKAGKLISLVPSNLQKCDATTLSGISEVYQKDLPAPEVLEEELERWRSKYNMMPESDCPSSYSSALQACDEAIFPNVYTLLKLGCTIPVTSCECERNISCLRRLSNYMRASMGQERLSALALMHIHYGVAVDVATVVDTFAKRQPRRLELLN